MSVCPFIRLSVINSCYRICSGAIYHKDLIMVSVCWPYRVYMHLQFLCRLRSIATHRDHFVRRLSVYLSVCPSVCHTPIAMFRRRHMHSSECCHYFHNALFSAGLVDTCSMYAYSLCVRLANQGMLTSHGPLVSLLVSMDVHCATLLFVSWCINSFVFKRYIHLYFIFATILSLWSLFNLNQDYWHRSFDCSLDT